MIGRIQCCDLCISRCALFRIPTVLVFEIERRAITVVYEDRRSASYHIVGVGVVDGEVLHPLQAGPDLHRRDRLGGLTVRATQLRTRLQILSLGPLLPAGIPERVMPRRMQHRLLTGLRVLDRHIGQIRVVVVVQHTDRLRRGLTRDRIRGGVRWSV